MRTFIRHPTQMPIVVTALETANSDPNCAPTRTKNVSAGGLCCRSGERLQVGSKVHVRIPVGSNAFESDGTVAWCAASEDGYEVGIHFAREDISFGLRMVEQVCRIQSYRDDVLTKEGRSLSEDEAAHEWIARYAAEFPS